jgi:hypothetical protein
MQTVQTLRASSTAGAVSDFQIQLTTLNDLLMNSSAAVFLDWRCNGFTKSPPGHLDGLCHCNHRVGGLVWSRPQIAPGTSTGKELFPT